MKEVDYKLKEYTNIGSIEEDIVYLEDNKPKDKELYKIWRENFNFLVEKSNFIRKFAAYKKI